MKKLVIVVFTFMLAISCSDNIDNSGNTVLKVRLTDSPGEYQEVLIDINDVKYYVEPSDADTGYWESLEMVNSGIYNLLDFTNGVDTLLAEETLPAGYISQIRLILGENNQVMIDSVYHDLKTPSGQTSGLKLQVNAELIAGIEYEIMLDFDAGRSVVETGNGKYILKPVIRVFTESNSGAVEGVIDPAVSKSYVMSISEDLDTTGTYADTITGEFLLSGLDAGSYTIEVHPTSEFDMVMVEDVSVEIGQVVALDTIFLSQSK